MAALIKIFNTVGLAGSQDERINHLLPNFGRFEIAADVNIVTDKAIRIYQIEAGIETVTQVTYDTTIGQENTDYLASMANIDAAVI